MTFTTLFRRRAYSTVQRRSKRLASGFRPRLEILEDRLAPAAHSLDVAIIGSPNCVNGGNLPTQGAAYTGFNFTNLAPADVNAANLAPYDTVVLNEASPEVQSSPLSAQAEAALVAFVGSGHKMIIYDSELPKVDYTWLPFPFDTNNPGAQGASGALDIVENSTLASKNSFDASFIDASLVATQTDAIGDANVFTTQNPNWYIAMSATNANNVTGAMSTYARFSNPGSANTGLIIYNGMDIDVMGSGSQPGITGVGYMAKIWLQELQQPFNPDNLPSGVAAVGITLNPATETLNVGKSHTVTAAVNNNLGQPQPGVPVSFKILSGPNAGLTGTANTNNLGEASFTYTGSGGVGTDEIQASYMDSSQHIVDSRIVNAVWINPSGGALSLISFTPPSPGEFHPFTATVATFRSADSGATASDFTATIAWGDGTTSVATAANGIVQNANGSFSVVAGHTYSQESTGLPFSVTIHDASGNSVSASGTVNVAEEPLEVTAQYAPSPLSQLTHQMAVDTSLLPWTSSENNELQMIDAMSYWFQLAAPQSGSNALDLFLNEMKLAYFGTLAQIQTMMGISNAAAAEAAEEASESILLNPLYATSTGYNLGLCTGAWALEEVIHDAGGFTL